MCGVKFISTQVGILFAHMVSFFFLEATEIGKYVFIIAMNIMFPIW